MVDIPKPVKDLTTTDLKHLIYEAMLNALKTEQIGHKLERIAKALEAGDKKPK